MRIPRTWITPLARRVVDTLKAEELIITEMGRDQLAAVVEEIITEELLVEDRLNDEVREILRQYEREIDSGRMDYRRLFDLTKKKLVRERNIIL
jgi:hypothetical protein